MKNLLGLKGRPFQFFCTVTANLMAITEGMSFAWTAPMIPYFLSEHSHIKMTENETEWLETWFVIGGLVGVPFTAVFIEKAGAKNSLLLAILTLTVSWVIIGISNSLEYIYVARGIMGLVLNTAYIAAPMYVGEISDKNIRGFLSSNIYVMQLSGMILMYSVGPYTPYYVAPCIASGILLLELAIFSFMPQSPYYFLTRDQPERAKQSLEKFRGNVDVELELQEIIKSIDLENEQQVRLQDIFLVKNYRKALLIMTVLNIAQPFSSFEIMIMNIHEILSQSGSVFITPSVAAIIFSTINLTAVLIASVVMDKLGRKKLLIGSSFLSGLCIAVLAAYYNVEYVGYKTQTISWIPIICVFLFAAVFKFGLGLVPIVITAEIFSTKIKAIGMTLADGIYMVGIISALQVFFYIKTHLGMYVAFYIFSCCSFITSLFVIFYIPETKGKTLEEIQDILKK